jgi:hypothetical protein
VPAGRHWRPYLASALMMSEGAPGPSLAADRRLRESNPTVTTMQPMDPIALVASTAREVTVTFELVALGVVVLTGCWYAGRVWRRRRTAQTMIVTTFPGIELMQPYGGWNADAYDLGTGHGPPAARLTDKSGPPSTWGWLP